MLYEELRQLIAKISEAKVQDYQKPEASHYSKSAIYQFAADLSMAFRDNGNTFLDVHEVVKKLNGTIHCVNTQDFLSSGSIYVHGRDDFDIVLPNFTSKLRDRFTIAHELGHFFLHSIGGERKIYAERKGRDLCEVEANWFAASFLMPENMINGLTAEQISVMFGVSLEAAEIRRKSQV